MMVRFEIASVDIVERWKSMLKWQCQTKQRVIRFSKSAVLMTPCSRCLPQGQAGAFEEGDDCTVPSTPTLYVPRRGDGFAEAIR